jgi:hypothetical protein
LAFGLETCPICDAAAVAIMRLLGLDRPSGSN